MIIIIVSCNPLTDYCQKNEINYYHLTPITTKRKNIQMQQNTNQNLQKLNKNMHLVKTITFFFSYLSIMDVYSKLIVVMVCWFEYILNVMIKVRLLLKIFFLLIKSYF